ncbi:MAG: hypothetical protein JST55_05870 [Bacteroidetes bacterium]|nr:hypothetical protein [Bacteroidota bacterium]
MKKTNLIEILSTFTSKELKEFGDFIDSPYFNKSNNVNLLFSYLKKLHPDFPKESIEKEIVFKKVFNKDEYNDGFMRLQIHTLNKLAEDFISISKFRQNNFLKDRFLLEYYVLDKKSPKLFERKFNSVKEKNSRIEIKDADYFLNEYEVEILYGKYKFLIDDNILNVTDLPKEEYFKKIEYLKANFFITILNQYRFLLNTKSLLNVSYEDDFREVVIEYLNSHPDYMNIPVLKLHYLELMLLLKDDEKYYFELKSHLTDYFTSFSWGEKFSTMCILENFCLSMLYKDKMEYHEEKHALHKFIIEHKLFSKYEGGKITDTDFQNITSTGIRLGKLEWVEKFIAEYKDYLEDKDKENVMNLCYTKLSMHNKNFDKALEYLNRITDIDDVNYKVSKKCITLEIYIEKGLFVEALTFIDNFKHFVANDNLMTETDKDRMSKYIKFTNDLIKIVTKKDPAEIHFFKKELDETNNVYNKRWLLKKAEELITDKKKSYA